MVVVLLWTAAAASTTVTNSSVWLGTANNDTALGSVVIGNVIIPIRNDISSSGVGINGVTVVVVGVVSGCDKGGNFGILVPVVLVVVVVVVVVVLRVLLFLLMLLLLLFLLLLLLLLLRKVGGNGNFVNGETAPILTVDLDDDVCLGVRVK